MSAVLIRKARMVLPTVLGIDAEVEFFHSEPKEGPRYVELKATINGQPVEEKIPVTDLVSPGEIALLEWPNQDRLKIDLTKWGISKFTEDQVFDLTAVAYSPASGYSKESAMEVKIPLPVIIVHGTILKEWWDQDSYWEPYTACTNFLQKTVTILMIHLAIEAFGVRLISFFLRRMPRPKILSSKWTTG